jgi:four helix bundle protein
MAGVREYSDLDAWKLSDEGRQAVDLLMLARGFDEHPDLQHQLRRAIDSPCPNIAEGFARYYPRDFARFVRIARGSLAESLEHLHRAAALKVITATQLAETARILRRAIGATTRLALYLETAEAPRTRPRRRRAKRDKPRT